MRVLIAEDDPISRRILQSSLLRWGYEVEVVCDGTQAWEAIQKSNAPRLIVLDWMMPGMDGLEICRALRDRASGPYVYTILLTAKAQRDDVLAGLGAGADDYVMKPFDPDELRVRLRAGKRVLDLQAQLLAERESQRMKAVRDPLTGLPNRLLYGEQLADRIIQAERTGQNVGVMFLDLDHFKAVNDTLGHNVGDQLLKSVAQRVTGALRQSDVVARIAGDEFTFVLGPHATKEDAVMAAKRVLSSLSTPLSISGHEIAVTGSIGISMYPKDGTNAETLVRNADAAMYLAKEQGRNAYCVFAEEFTAADTQQLCMETELQHALADNQLVLHHQVRMDLRSGLALGTEALIRWRHPEMGLLPPCRFIETAENTGAIEPITKWVIQQACAQNKSWHDSGFQQMDVSVNISSRVFHESDLVLMVKKALQSTGMKPKYLCLETTEAVILKDPEHAVDLLTKLKETGIRICIDDFGSGYSSLGDLKRLPVDAVKMDPSFVRGVVSNKADAAMAGAIIAMAHELGLRVTAEGVETLEQLELLKSIGCDEVQGYFISRPVEAQEIVHLLAEGTPPLANWRSLAA